MNQTEEIQQITLKSTNLIPYIILASIVFIGFIAVGFIIPSETTEQIIQELQAAVELLESLSPVALMMVIFINNAVKCLFVILLGILVGLPPAIFICYNALMIGMLVAALGPELGYGIVVASLLPHGIIEIPALVFSAALGLSIGAEVWKFIIRQKSQVKNQLKFSLVFYIRWLLLALLVAAIIEVFVTPLIISSTGFIPPI